MGTPSNPETPKGMRALLQRLRARERSARASYMAGDRTRAQRAASRDTLQSTRRSIARWTKRLDRATAQPTIGVNALRHVCPWLTQAQAKTIAEGLGAGFAKYDINTPRRAAMAVAQMAHESAGFRTSTEYASGAAYEGRADLGNVRPGDGRRFRGRSRIQITGRTNYTAVSRALGVDFVATPAKLAESPWSEMAACWWWSAHGCSAIADTGDFIALTRRINGGVNGLADRQELYARARQVQRYLTPR